MISDNKTMGFITNKLQELQRRFVRINDNRIRLPFHIDFFHTLGKANDRCISSTASDHRKRSIHLAFAAVKNNQIRSWPLGFYTISPCHNFCHRLEIIGRPLSRLQFESAVFLLLGRPLSNTTMDPVVSAP